MYREEIENYIAQLGKSSNTCESYRRDLTQMEDFLCSNDGTQAGDYADLIAETKPASSVARIYSAMNGFFKYMIAKGIMEENPMDGHIAPKITKNPRPVYDEDERSRLVAMPKGYGNKAVRDRAMFSVMFDTGYKVTKLIGLKVNDANGLKLTPETRNLLEDYIYGTRDRMLGKENHDMLFINYSGKPLTRQGFWKIFKGYVNGDSRTISEDSSLRNDLKLISPVEFI